MPAIVTVTFSPCIDKSTTIPVLVPEKKLLCAAPTLEPGGGGINVARAITKLGGQATAIYPAGGYTGNYFTGILQQENIPSIAIKTVNATRENMIVLDLASNKQYRFGMPGTLLREEEWQQCLEAIENIGGIEFIIASGSLPPGVPHDIFARIAVIAKYKKAKLVIDTSGDALQLAANEGVYLLKPNLGELASLTGKEELNEQEVYAAGRELIAKGNCELVVISMGASGAVLISKHEQWRAVAPIVKTQSTVGAGDSMVAGVVLSLSHNKPLKEVLQYGVACGTAATLRPGAELCRAGDVHKLFDTIRCSPVQ